MKKIKFLILALLGITIIPSITNAYDVVNKFNGNYGLLYKEFRGSVLYRCPYTSNIDLSSNPSWKATSSSFPCIPGLEFSNRYNRGQFAEGRFVDINQDVAQYITAIKKKDGNYLPIGVNLQRKFGKFQVEHKNGTVYYDEVKADTTYQYEVNLKSQDGRYGQLLGGLFLDGLFIKGFSRENGNAYDPGYQTVVVLDPDTRMGYRFNTNISLKEALDTSFISLFYSLYNSSPSGCFQFSTDYWRRSFSQYSPSHKNNCPQFDIKQKLEKSLTISQGFWKLFKEESPYYDPNYKVNKILGEVPETTAPSVNSAEAYNQCSSYWSDVKNLAYYSQKCGDDPADEQTQNWVKVDSWNAEGNLPEFSEGANKNKCGRFANAKKKYKEKYKDNRGKFYADFGTYARTPEGVNVEVLCKGVELEHGAANSNTGNVQATDDTPMTNWIKRLPLVGLTADYLYNPVANFFTNGSLRLLGKLDNVVCNVGGSGYVASDILSDKERLDSLASDCKAGVVDSCASLSLFKDSLFEKYKSCKDETHFIRNNLGDVWNKNFSDMSFVDKVVSLVKAEYNQGRNVFPVYYCSSGGISKEWDYLVWVLFLASAVILFRLFF